MGFSNPLIEEVVVMGRFIYAHCTSFYKGTISRRDNWINFDINNENHEAEMQLLCELGLDDFMIHLCKFVLPTIRNWGDGEQDYQYASGSGKWQIRKMVALNGRYLKTLSKDVHFKVRIAVVAKLSLSLNIKSKASSKDKQLNYLDEMILDENVEVRRAIAHLGITKYLKHFLLDDDARVVDNAIRHASAKQIAMILPNLPHKVHYAMARNENATLEQLEALSTSPEITVQYTIARRGVITKDMLNSKNAGVRAMIAKFGALRMVASLAGNGWGINDSDWKVRQEMANRGFGHALLCNDIHEVVRLAVAKNANEYILKKLACDGSELIADTANRRLKGEEDTPDKYRAIGQHHFYERHSAHKESSSIAS